MNAALRARKACEKALASVPNAEWVEFVDVLKQNPDISLRAIKAAIKRLEAEDSAVIFRDYTLNYPTKLQIISFRRPVSLPGRDGRTVAA